MNHSSIGIIGSGVMGQGLVQLFIENGFKVVFNGRNKSNLEYARNRIKQELLLYRKDENLLNNLVLSTTIDDLREIDILIEAVKEDFDIKKNLITKIIAVCKTSIVCTNTSSLSIDQLSAGFERGKIVGVHFLNPVRKMKLVEIVKGRYTSNDAVQKLKSVVEKVGKKTVLVPDIPGFLVNRLMVPHLLEAVHLYEQGITKEDIDKAATLGLNYLLGPLALIDLLGLDIFLHSCKNLESRTGEAKFKVPKIITKLVSEGKLGQKSGEGFYKY